MLPHLPVPRLTLLLATGGLVTAFLALPIAALTTTARSVPPADPCAVPIEIAPLSARDQGFVARRLLACSDLVHARITASEYLTQVHAIDEAWNAKPAVARQTTQWASTVRSFSTEYSDSAWSASRVLGPPDVFPGSGDNANAWASKDADDRDEWIEVGFAQPTTAGAVEVYETYNPGAVRSIELLSAAGTVIAAHETAPHASGAAANRLRADFECTSEPVAAVRVRLGSKQVPGWNEVDAIGLVPCGE